MGLLDVAYIFRRVFNHSPDDEPGVVSAQWELHDTAISSVQNLSRIVYTRQAYRQAYSGFGEINSRIIISFGDLLIIGCD